MTNVTTLKPNEPGERRGGRQVGATNLQTRAMKTAMFLAAEESKHSDGSLKSYLKFLADERPELFAPMLARLIPIQAKVTTDTPLRLDPSMSMEELIRNFEMKIKDPNYRAAPRVIEHDDVEVESNE